MNCPTCHAKLLPVKGQLFCLQCGRLVGASEAEPEVQAVPGPVSRPAAQQSVPRPAPKAVSRPVSAASKPMPKLPEVPQALIARPAPKMVTRTAAEAPVVPAVTSPAAGVAQGSFPGVAGVKAGLPTRVSATGWHRRYVPWPVITGLVLLAVLAVGDVFVRSYYQDRVYPGVSVADRSLGGQPLSTVSGAVKQALPVDTVHFTIGTTDYTMKPGDLGGKTNADTLAAQVRAAGRNSSFALIGVLETLFSKPLQPGYEVDERVVRAAAQRMAVENSHPPADAQPLIVGTTPIVIAEKSGQQVDQNKLYDGLMIALKHHQKVTISATRLSPAVTAASYTGDVEDAQAKIGLNLSIKIKNTTVGPNAGVIAGWLRFGDPGSGVQPDVGKVAAYLSGVAGKFDRSAAQEAILGAISAKQSLVYTASTKRNVAAAGVAPLPPVIRTYSFCSAVRGVAGMNVVAITTKAQSTLDNAQGWTLNGKLKFLSSSGNCNVTVWVASPDSMGTFAPACAGQSSCQTGNDVVINTTNWNKQPADWKGTLDQYQVELINHEMGHWLGFDHAKCSETPEAAPLNQPTLNVTGCSPQWYAIPAELQGRKVLPGF